MAACGRLNYDELAPSDAEGGDAAPADGGTEEFDGDVDTPLLCGTGEGTSCPAQRATIGIGSDGTLGKATDVEADLLQGSCGGAGYGELRVGVQASEAVTARFDVRADFDTALYLVGANCNGAELACDNQVGNGGEQLQYRFKAGEKITVVIDGVDGCGEVLLDMTTMP